MCASLHVCIGRLVNHCNYLTFYKPLSELCLLQRVMNSRWIIVHFPDVHMHLQLFFEWCNNWPLQWNSYTIFSGTPVTQKPLWFRYKCREQYIKLIVQTVKKNLSSNFLLCSNHYMVINACGHLALTHMRLSPKLLPQSWKHNYTDCLCTLYYYNSILQAHKP